MTAEQLQLTTLDDIVFEHRNKAYGAYDLRLRYNQTARWALWLGISLFGAGLLVPTLYAHLKPEKGPEMYMETVDLTDIKLKQPEEPPVVVPPAPEVKPVLPTMRYLPPEVVQDAPEETTVATVDELAEKTPSDKTEEGDPNAVDRIEAPNESAAPTVTEKALDVERKTDEVFTFVEQQPQFPGGTKAFAEFMQKNLRYPAEASRANVSGKVFVSFIVDADGSITNIEVLKGIGFGCDEEAVRVMNKMPRWQPGKQSGRPVKVKFNLPVTFSLE